MEMVLVPAGVLGALFIMSGGFVVLGLCCAVFIWKDMRKW
tara:strand:+ start:37564 stop:37683 length:120 start_codon:yes stop_codon:yes gene_type:complete